LIRIPRFIAIMFCVALLPVARAVDATHNGAQRAHIARPHAKPKSHMHAAPIHDPQAQRWIDIAGFGEVAIYKPAGASRGLVLFASGDGGWNLGVLDMAHHAAALGFWVAGFSTPKFLKGLDGGDATCSDADGLLAKLGADLIRQLQLPLDTRPMLIGYSSGATVVYAALAADAGQRFGGGISLGFCPDLLITKPFCAGRGGLTQQKQKSAPFGYVFDKRETVDVPWRIVQGEIDKVCEPKFASEFAAGQADANAVMLPHVGHGFGVPKNWMPQYVHTLKDLLDTPPRNDTMEHR
jgi:type IV secretory pathway VirJ component